MQNMGVLQMVVYRPYQEKEAAVLDLIRYHRGLTVGKGLASRSPSVYLRTKDRSIIELCEWESTTSIADASHDPMIGGEAWKAFENACDMLTLSRLPESQQTYPTFQHMDVITTTGLSSIEDGRYALCVYQVQPNKEDDFARAWAEHRKDLEGRGLVTAFQPKLMRSGNGAVVELWEWASGESMGEAWTVGWTGLSDDQVKDKMSKGVPAWCQRFDGLCTFVPLSSLPEAHRTYPVFTPITLDDPSILQAPTHFASTSEGIGSRTFS